MLRLTCSRASLRQPGVFKPGTVQQVVSLQEAVERAEDGGVEDGGQRHDSSSGQEGVDKTPAGHIQVTSHANRLKLS